MNDVAKFKVLTAYFMGAGIDVVEHVSSDGKRTEIKGDTFTIVVTNLNYFLVYVGDCKEAFRNQLDVVGYLHAKGAK